MRLDRPSWPLSEESATFRSKPGMPRGNAASHCHQPL